MKTRSRLIVTLFCMLVIQANAADQIRFASVGVYLDSTDPVAAWQFELSENSGSMQVVGVEGGDSAVYQRAPYYDREAVQLGTADRITVADYSVADASELPSGRTRIATVHVMLSGPDDPNFVITLVTAVQTDGSVIAATLSLKLVTGSEQ